MKNREVTNAKLYRLRDLLHPNQTWTFPLNNIVIKVPKCTNNGLKVCNFFRFLDCFQYFKLYVLTSEINIIKCCNQNIAVLLNVIASTVL